MPENQEVLDNSTVKGEGLTEEQKKARRIRTGTLLAALLILLLWGIYLLFDYNQLAGMEPDIYFSNDQEWTDWDGLDYEIEDGGVRISRYEYVAPHFNYYFSLDEVQEVQETAALKVNMQLDNFLNSTFSLLTVFTPAGNVSVITDKDGRIGLVSGPEGDPEFSERRIDMENSHDIYLFLDSPNGEVSAYVDGTRAVSVERDFEVYPLQDVWMGAVWIGGNNDFGAPIGYTINEFALGNEDLIIAAYSMQEFMRVIFEESPWLWIPPAIALVLLVVFLALWIAAKRRDKQKDEIDSGTDESGTVSA